MSKPLRYSRHGAKRKFKWPTQFNFEIQLNYALIKYRIRSGLNPFDDPRIPFSEEILIYRQLTPLQEHELIANHYTSTIFDELLLAYGDLSLPENYLKHISWGGVRDVPSFPIEYPLNSTVRNQALNAIFNEENTNGGENIQDLGPPCN